MKFALIAICLMTQACTVATDYGMATMGNASHMGYKSKAGATWEATNLNHSEMAGAVKDGVTNMAIAKTTQMLGGDIIKEGADVVDKLTE